MSRRSTPFIDGLDDTIIGLDANGSPYPVRKLDAHLRSTRHRAVSVFLLDADRLLIQRRAMGKYHSAGLWANTACSHPLWDEPAPACADRILGRELGVSTPLRHFATIEYEASVGDLFENEVVDCFVGRGRAGMALRPDPDEVDGTRWIGLDALGVEVASNPTAYAPWLRIYVKEKGILTSLRSSIGFGGSPNSSRPFLHDG